MKPSKIDGLIADRMNEIKLPHTPKTEELVNMMKAGGVVLIVRKCPHCGNNHVVEARPIPHHDE